MSSDVVIPRELWVKFVQFADQEHRYWSAACHPTPGEDCEIYCPACWLIRQVSDDVLREARRRAQHEPVY